MGLRCSKPPKFDKLPAYTPLDACDEELLRRLSKMVKNYDKTLDRGAINFQERATYGSEMLAIVKEFGYTGALLYPYVRIYAGKLLAPVASVLKE